MSRTSVLTSTSGRLVKSMGDGLMVEVLGGAAGRKSRQRDARLDGGAAANCWRTVAGCRFRAGLHASNIFDAKTDIYGVGVNLAARIATLAEGGETVATVEVRDLLSDETRRRRRGPGRLPLEACRTPCAGLPPGAGAAGDQPPEPGELFDGELCASLAVIPFANPLSPDASMGMGDIIADGVIGAALAVSRPARRLAALDAALPRRGGAPVR